MRALTFFVSLFFLVGCSCGSSYPCFCGCNGSRHLSLLSEAVTKETFASTHVNTPDTNQLINPQGQRITVSWKLPKKYLDQPLHGVLSVQFKIPKAIKIPFEIERSKGSFVYQLLGDEYFEKEGILSYKAQIFSNNVEIDSFTHKMWVELVSFETLEP